MNINPIRPSEVLDQAQLAFETGRIFYLEGAGGVGKTSIISKVVAPALGLDLWTVNLNGKGPQEATGYGIPDAATRDMYFAEPTDWPTVRRVGDKPCLLNLDELNDYDPAVKPLLRGLFPASGASYVGSHKLGPNVFMTATGNRRCDGVRSARVMDAPMTERCVVYTLVSELGDWLEWLDGEFSGSPMVQHRTVVKGPRPTDAESHVPTFLKYGSTTGDGVDHFNPDLPEPYDGRPHPRPRTWEAVILAEHVRKTKPDVYRKHVKGCVGDAAASAYFGFLSHVDRLPDIAALKAKPEAFTVPDDPQVQFALVSACLATALQGVKDPNVAVHAGAFDWMVSLLLRCRGDIREFGTLSAVRRGIPLDMHAKAMELIITA